MFIIPEILVPSENIDLTLWSEIACDQYVLNDEYWRKDDKDVSNNPSFLRLILPQNSAENQESVKIMQTHMNDYLQDGTLKKLGKGTVYIEREMSDGGIRDGILLGLDLNCIGIGNGKVMFSEKTNEQYIINRLNYLQDSPLDSSHVLVGIDDPEDKFFDSIRFNAKETIYDFYLKNKGGRIKGRRCEITKKGIENSLNLINKKSPIFIADGNHSVLSALKHWERLGKPMNSPARFLLVELINIHDPAVKLYPIHRVCINFNEQQKNKLVDLGFVEIRKNYFKCPQLTGIHLIDLYSKLNELLKKLQESGCCNQVEFVHENKELKESEEKGYLIIEMRPIDKSSIFEYLYNRKILPMKSVSIGHSIDKRFYIETRVRL